MDKVLVYCPLRPGESDMRSINSIISMRIDGIADFAFGKNGNEVIKGFSLQRDENICAKYNEARSMAIAGNYDAMMTIEDDMLVPADALQKLAAVDADICYGLYVSRHGKHPWLTFEKVTEQVRGSKQLGETQTEREALWGKVVETAGVGLGCTYIRRPVLDAISFRITNNYIANDWYFAIDAADAGFVQKHDCSVVCGHIDNYQILWPDVVAGWVASDVEKINIQEIIDMADGVYVVLYTLDLGDRFAKPGEEVELSDEVAEVLLGKRAIKPAAKKTAAKPKKEDEVKSYDANN